MKKTLILIFLLALLVIPLSYASAQESEVPVVRGLLFYRTTCPYCHQIINEMLLPMMDQEGEQLDIRGVNIDEPQGQLLYDTFVAQYNIPNTRLGVPTMLVGDEVMVGAQEIPNEFPGIYQQGLAAGGIDWPDLRGLNSIMAAEDPQAASDNAVVPLDRALSGGQPEGASLARIVFVAMFGALGVALWQGISGREALFDIERESVPLPAGWPMAALALAGLAISAYLAYLKLSSGAEAVCGPIGDCSAVQDHETSIFLGVPVAVWGVLGYAAILAAWFVQQRAEGKLGGIALSALAGLTLVGSVYSLYLTYLEIAVIRAVCLWCLGSAAIMAALMVLVFVNLPEMVSAQRRASRLRRRRRRR